MCSVSDQGPWDREPVTGECVESGRSVKLQTQLCILAGAQALLAQPPRRLDGRAPGAGLGRWGAKTLCAHKVLEQNYPQSLCTHKVSSKTTQNFMYA